MKYDLFAKYLRICICIYIYTLGHTHKYARSLSDLSPLSADNDRRSPIIVHAFLHHGKRRLFFFFPPLPLISITRYLLLDRQVCIKYSQIATRRRRKRRREDREASERDGASERANERASASRPSGSRQRELEAWKPYNWDG